MTMMMPIMMMGARRTCYENDARIRHAEEKARVHGAPQPDVHRAVSRRRVFFMEVAFEREGAYDADIDKGLGEDGASGFASGVTARFPAGADGFEEAGDEVEERGGGQADSGELPADDKAPDDSDGHHEDSDEDESGKAADQGAHFLGAAIEAVRQAGEPVLVAVEPRARLVEDALQRFDAQRVDPGLRAAFKQVVHQVRRDPINDGHAQHGQRPSKSHVGARLSGEEEGPEELGEDVGEGRSGARVDGGREEATDQEKAFRPGDCWPHGEEDSSHGSDLALFFFLGKAALWRCGCK